MLAHLGALARHLASLVRHLGADMASNSKQNAIFEPTSLETTPKMPQPSLPSAENTRKAMVFECLLLSSRPEMLPEPPQKLPS